MALDERPIPESALRDADAVEMLRVWIAERGLHCSMKMGMYEESMKVSEETTWARILADVARHLANALEEAYRRNSKESLEQIRKAFNEELDKTPANMKGGFVQRH